MAISKDILQQYTSLQKEIAEVRRQIDTTEKQIQRIRREGTVIDTVSGGSGGIQHFKVEGFPEAEYSKKVTLLQARKMKLHRLETMIEESINEVEEFMRSLDDSYIRLVIRLRFIDNLSWAAVAARIGGGNSADGVRMAFDRFMEKYGE